MMLYFLAVVLFLLLMYKLVHVYNFWKSLGVPGPAPVPFFGNFARAALNQEYAAETTADIYKRYPEEKYVGIYRFTVPVLLLRDPELIKNVLVKDFEYFQDRGVEFSKEGLGANLFHADGDTWVVLRRKTSPLFTAAKIRNMFYLIRERAKKFAKFVESLAEVEPELEMHAVASRYVGDTIGACAFGVDIDAINSDENRFLRVGREQFLPSWRVTLDLAAPGSLRALRLDMFPAHIKRHYDGVVGDILRQRRGRPKIHHDFIDLMMELKEAGTLKGTKVRSDQTFDLEITDAVITAQAFIFFGAGFDTTTTTLAIMLYELALNTDIQDKLFEEITSTLTKHGGLTYEALKDMKYMDKVILETLRKYPVIDITRKAVKNYRIPGTEIVISKGTHLFIPKLGINRDEKYYPEPHKFDPERIVAKNSAFMPFGAGPRDCIGKRFAMAAMKTCAAELLSSLQVLVCSRTAPRLPFGAKRFTLHPEGGVWLTLRAR